MKSSSILCTLILLIQLSGCVGEGVKTIRPEDTTWIQRGKTTRQEVVAKFGEPSFVGTIQGEGQYAEYNPPRPPAPSLEPRPAGPLPQSYQPPAQAAPGGGALGERFWVIYDAGGVVKDYGIGPPPGKAGPSGR